MLLVVVDAFMLSVVLFDVIKIEETWNVMM